MTPLVFDATPLIYLTRIGLIRLIEEIPTRKFTTRSVFREVVEQGKAKGSADALVLARLFETNKINISEPTDIPLLQALRKIRGLEEPDIETIALAKECGYTAVLDDLLARKVAGTYGIDFVGTPYIPILGIKNRLLSKRDALSAVDDMIEAGWRCGPELYREIIRIIEGSR